ncbi:MAG: hypothetical protein ACI4XM_07540 [Candidatus Coprovivens sp.]
MNKFKSFIKDNWIFVFFVIPFVLICFYNKQPDNDIWFILNNGRYIFEYGIPHIDPFTIHEGLKYVMQQWGTSALFWGVFHYFGYKSLLVFVYIFSFLFMYIFYKLCYVVSEKKKISVIVSSLVFCLIYQYIVLRPQIISYTILILEILLVELFIKKKNNKYLYPLPFLSLLIINMHTAMWYFQFVFLLPFILNGIKWKKLRFIEKLKVDRYELKPILIVALLMFLVGFLNPYGYEALTYIFKSYGIASINNVVGEMYSISWDYYQGKVVFCFIIFFMLLISVKRDLKIDIRHILFVCGLTLLGFMHCKCYPLFVLIFSYVFMYSIRGIGFTFSFVNNKIIRSLINGLSIGFGIFLFGTLIYTIYYSYSTYSFTEKYKTTDTLNYLLENYNKDDVSLYISFNTGGYAEYLGLKSYIDGRAELFFKRFNGKDDIFDEAVAIESDVNFDFDKFIDKYKFTHIMVYDFSNFNRYLEDCDQYDLVYSDNIGYDVELKWMLYTRKNMEVLE